MIKKCPHCNSVLTRGDETFGLIELVNNTLMNDGNIVTKDFNPMYCESCGYAELEIQGFQNSGK